MKHLLNNISEEEKNSILEQHKGGMRIFNENFNKMINKKLGHVELYEQQTQATPSDKTDMTTQKLSELPDTVKTKFREVGFNSDAIPAPTHSVYNPLAIFKYSTPVLNWLTNLILERKQNYALADAIKEVTSESFADWMATNKTVVSHDRKLDGAPLTLSGYFNKIAVDRYRKQMLYYLRRQLERNMEIAYKSV